MIAVGSSNRCVWWWSQHLEAENNEEVRLVQTHGLGEGSVRDMLEQMIDLAQGTRCKNPFYEIHFSPAPGERLTEKEWDRVREVTAQSHGFEEQPYFMLMHTKHGEQHVHMVFSRINLETGKTISDSHDARTNHAIAREVAQEFGLQQVIGPYDREPGTPRPDRAPKRWEMLRGMYTAIDPREVAAQVTGLFEQSHNGRVFKAALEEHGYELVTGRRGLLILDSAGKEHSLARRCGIKTAELDTFMRNVDRDALPTVEQAKAAYQERKIAGLEADRATVAHEIEWEEKLAQAAIEKEKTERQFVEPEETRGGRQQPELTGAARHIREARERSDNAPAFTAALFEHGIGLAQATKADAAQSQLDSAEATIAGYWKPAFREGEIVAVTDQGQVWKLTQRTTGEKHDRDIQNFLGGLAAPLPSIDDARRDLEEQRRFRSMEADIDLGKTAASIRLAYNLSDSPLAFKAALEQDGLTAARVVWQDIHQRDNGGKQEKGLSEQAREGDVVILDKWGNLYELNQRTTGDTRRDAQGFVAGIGDLPSIDDARRELEEKPRRPIHTPTGPQHGGLVAHQMWALRNIQQRHEEQRRDQDRWFREQTGKKSAGEVDPARYLTDPDYRREVRTSQSFKTLQEQKTERENDLRALMEQQDRQR